jgi:ABC-type multidrug transport system fused ATPase/permease subunit
LAANESPVSVLRVAPRTVMEIIAFSVLIGFILWTTARPDQGTEWIPAAGAFALCGYRLLPSLSLVYSQMVTFVTRRAVVDELLHTLEETARPASAAAAFPDPPPFHHHLRLRLAAFTYPGETRAVLGPIDLLVPKGSHAGIVGPTGSGKSTLLDLLLGLHLPDEGGLELDGAPLPPAALDAYRTRVGYVPQDVYLLDGSVRDNICFGQPPDEERLRRAARAARIDAFLEHELPDGYNTRVGERGLRLSGGQRQRIALARALYRDPDILVLDEATSALDQETERALLGALASWTPRLTVITVAHRPAAVRGADRIHVLDRGRIVASGTFPELERGNALFGSLVASSPPSSDAA